MQLLRFEPTQIAEWQALVLEAQHNAGYNLDESLESYLVLTLDYFTTQRQLSNTVLAIELLEGADLSGREGNDKLREVGDQCLLLSGLFPERAKRKNVSLNYFIGLGRNAYLQLGSSNILYHLDAELFYKLSEHFVGLMDVLNSMRGLSAQRHLQ